MNLEDYGWHLLYASPACELITLPFTCLEDIPEEFNMCTHFIIRKGNTQLRVHNGGVYLNHQMKEIYAGYGMEIPARPTIRKLLLEYFPTDKEIRKICS